MQRGFTLIEVVVVIAVLGILSAMALPSINQTLADRELDNAARMLVGGLRSLQQRCINTAENTPGGFPVMGFKKTAPGSGYYVKLNLQPIDGVTFADSVQILKAPESIVFGMNGFPTTPATITLSSIKTNKLKYVIIASTGRIRISDSSTIDGTVETAH